MLPIILLGTEVWDLSVYHLGWLQEVIKLWPQYQHPLVDQQAQKISAIVPGSRPDGWTSEPPTRPKGERSFAQPLLSPPTPNDRPQSTN